MPVKDLPQWVKRARTYPLGFAQVREDPLLDVWAIDQLHIPAANIIMIASGGCTASLLATKARLSILHNIVEEHGDMNSDDFHSITFKQFLSSLGYEQLDYSKIPIWPQLRAFNGALATACMLDEIEVGIACMGIIERSFATISAIARERIFW